MGEIWETECPLPIAWLSALGAVVDSVTRSPIASTFIKNAKFLCAIVCCIVTLESSASSEVEGYIIEEVEGWRVYVQEELFDQEPENTARALVLLTEQGQKVIDVIPEKIVEQLQTVPLWLSLPHEGRRPRAEFHPDKGWLINNGMIPEKEKGIEFTNTAILDREVVRMPMLLLHELSHAYHNLFLGFDQPDILRLYQNAKESGSYNLVERKNREPQVAYAMSNHKEYFAECTEAFFGENDFYPFNREQLEQHDPEMYALLERLWLSGAAL